MARARNHVLRYSAAMKQWLSLFVGLLLSATVHAAPQVLDIDWKDSARERVLPLKVRVPDGDARVPLVIFSHGLGGSREGGKTWGEHWAASGYLVMHVQHPGSDESLWRGSGEGSPKKRMARGATPEQLLGRVDDVRFVIDELTRLQARPDALAWIKRVDLSRIAMTGHSFGARTTMALAGERFPGPIKSMADPRITAFIAFSPTVQGAKKTWFERYGTMHTPFLSVTGSLDGDVMGNGSNPKNRAALFDAQNAGDKYRVVFADGDHSVFAGGDQSGAGGGHVRDASWLNRVTGEDHASTSAATAKVIHEQTRTITLKYLDAYLKSDAAAQSWLSTDAAKALGDAGAWSNK